MAYSEIDLGPFVRGDDWRLKLTVALDDTPLDVTNYTYWLTLKNNIDAVDANASLQTQILATGSDATNGIVYLTASSSDTALLEQGSYYYDIQQVSDTGNVQTLVMGKIKVVKDVTISNA